MKNTMLAVMLMAASSTVFAAGTVSDNTVRFKGEVSNQTCSLDINGNDKSPVVLLPTVSTSAFTGVGTTAGDTTFTVNVSGCSPVTDENGMEDQLSIGFLGNVVTSSNNLGNTGDAKNVSIQLADSADKNFKFTAGDLIKSETPITINADGSVTESVYTARYYAEDAKVIPGTVVASAQYAITYK
ncbi:fimbrial protein [Providencia burhodogranariea]|uniref:Minor fimbrial subunit hifD n=1 Tax=Providencia burhodogranariea DSM 19968 TaxID=1141662 RepID=K8WI33_9GAMM|nr:fimbrial protein [Providencia burhodogranariea]EKT60238.1 Minor fimbrial subunit hifD [Providencia burhodogranariea DSM 19968]